MHIYETLFVLQPGLTEERVDEIVSMLEAIVPENKGKLIKTEKWGKRKLAFRVGRHAEGYYTRYEYEGDGAVQRELERRMRIHEDVIRFLTTRVDPRMAAEIERRAEREKRAALHGDDRRDRDAAGYDEEPRERYR